MELDDFDPMIGEGVEALVDEDRNEIGWECKSEADNEVLDLETV